MGLNFDFANLFKVMQGLETLNIKSRLIKSTDFKIFDNYKGIPYNLK